MRSRRRRRCIFTSELEKALSLPQSLATNDLVEAGSEAVRTTVEMRTEGKTYVIADGDVVQI